MHLRKKKKKKQETNNQNTNPSLEKNNRLENFTKPESNSQPDSQPDLCEIWFSKSHPEVKANVSLQKHKVF